MPKKFSSRRKKIRRAEKFFRMQEKKIGRAEKFFGMTKKIRRDENFHENFGHAENFFGATNFYVRKLGMPKMEGDNFGMPNFCLVPRSGVDSFHF